MKIRVPSNQIEIMDESLMRLKFYQNLKSGKKPFVRIRFNESFQKLAGLDKTKRFILTLSRGLYSRVNRSYEYVGTLYGTSNQKEGFAVYKNRSQYLSLDDTHILNEIVAPEKLKNIWFSMTNVWIHDNGDIGFRFNVKIE